MNCIRLELILWLFLSMCFVLVNKLTMIWIQLLCSIF